MCVAESAAAKVGRRRHGDDNARALYLFLTLSLFQPSPFGRLALIPIALSF